MKHKDGEKQRKQNILNSKTKAYKTKKILSGYYTDVNPSFLSNLEKSQASHFLCKTCKKVCKPPPPTFWGKGRGVGGYRGLFLETPASFPHPVSIFLNEVEQNIVTCQWRADQLFADAEGRGK